MPEPRKGESQKEYVSRCIEWRRGKEGKDEPMKQSARICYEMWRQKHGKKAKS